MQLSVVIPTWRRSSWLKRCLSALCQQSLAPDEVIVVGRSADVESKAIVHQFRETIPIRWQEIDRSGHIAPVVLGVDRARGDLVAFLDDDAEPEPEWLAFLARNFDDASVACVGGQVLTHQVPPRSRRHEGSIRWYGRHEGNIGAVTGDSPLRVSGVMECNWAWRTSVLRQLEFHPAFDFDDASMYGLDLCLQAQSRGYEILYEPRARVFHHVAPRDGDLNRENRPDRAFAYSRNYTLLALRNFHGLQLIAFLIWWWTVGERGSYGVLSGIVDLILRGSVVIANINSSFRGKLEGVRTWRSEKNSVAREAVEESERSPDFLRILLVASHPVQYASPLYRLYSGFPNMDVQVAYCSLQGARPGKDPGFDREIAWDVPLLDGYNWMQIPNWSPRPSLERFFGLLNPSLWTLIRRKRFDVVVCFGHRYASFWIAAIAAKVFGAKLIFTSDAQSIERPGLSRVRAMVKKTILKVIYWWANAVFAPSSKAFTFFQELGVDRSRVFLIPYVVDSEYFARSDEEGRTRVRALHQISERDTCFLFVGKLIERKRPIDLVLAARGLDGASVLICGDGPLRAQVELTIGDSNSIKVLGFTNQSELPDLYAAADVLVIPSDHEPFGLVVNEAMAAGKPVIASTAVGAVGDLVVDGLTGFTYVPGDIGQLRELLRRMIESRALRTEMGDNARIRIEDWGPKQNATAFSSACFAVARG